jgi:hypothetical protein
MIRPLDVEDLRRRFRSARPFPYVVIDDFLLPEAAARVAGSYPSFDEALAKGFSFNFVNEQKKVQITDATLFPAPVMALNQAISSPEFIATMESITGIPRLLVDHKLRGGGMHLTSSGGRLDVHVDFNVIEEEKIYRRLNILVYLNPTWEDTWGGQIELWDKEVKHCHLRANPILNRCLVFETSNISYHGVAPISAPESVVRRSFAAYYYTAEQPVAGAAVPHSTIFRARPDERLRGLVRMPVERLGRELRQRLDRSKKRVKSWIGIG